MLCTSLHTCKGIFTPLHDASYSGKFFFHSVPQVDSLIQEKQEPDLSLEEEVLRNWTEVLLCDYDYDILERLAAELEGVSQEEVVDWLHRYTHPGKHYRKLSVKVRGELNKN